MEGDKLTITCLFLPCEEFFFAILYGCKNVKEKTLQLPKVGWEEKEKQEIETGTQTSASARTERSEDLAKAPRVQRQDQPPLLGLQGLPRPAPPVLRGCRKWTPLPQGHRGFLWRVTAPNAEPSRGQPDPPLLGPSISKVTLESASLSKGSKCPEPGRSDRGANLPQERRQG